MATTIRLRYGVQAKPVLNDREFETDIGNWTEVGTTYVVTQSDTQAHSGTYSMKIVGTGSGDFGTDYVKLDSAFNAAFTVTKKYCITFWAYPSLTGNIQIKTGGVTCTAVSATQNTWNACSYIFTSVTEATDLQIILAQDMTAYIDDIVVSEYVDLNVLSERGMSDPDSFDFFPQLQKTFLDGSMKDYIKGFRRKILVDVGVVASSTDRKQILYWMIDSDRTVDYLTEVNVPLALQDIGGFENNWLFDCSLARQFVFALQEPSIRTTFPV